MAPDVKTRYFFEKIQKHPILGDDSESSLQSTQEDNRCNGQMHDLSSRRKIEVDRVEQSIKWKNVVLLTVIHSMAIYSITFFPYIRWQSLIWPLDILIKNGMPSVLFQWQWAGFGVTGGVHRLWTHRSYKATLPLRIILMLGYASAGMNDIFEWVRDHRVHHKYSETDADPHNAKRGLFFSHVGWLMMKKHPEVIRRGKQVDMQDILNDPVCVYEIKHHKSLVYLLCFLLPTVIPVLFWEETWSCAFAVTMLRYVIVLNGVWSVNSAAHMFGGRPFNKFISPAENGIVSFFCLGEGWHNYHHVFPWDYKASEIGYLNISMHLIRFAAAVGLAYDLKTASPALVKRIVQRYGDGTLLHGDAGIPEIPREASDDHTLVERLVPSDDNKHQEVN